jgi:ribosomal subunit interface protein
MTLQVTGKNIDAGDAFKTYISDKLKTALGKYIGEEIAGHIRLEKERGRFHTQCSIKLRSGLALEANGEGGDAYGSADSAVEKLEKRVRRYKRRLKDHHSSRNGASEIPETLAGHYTVRVDDDGGESEGNHPVIIAESEKGIGEFAVSEAVMQLDLTEKQFLVFRNAAHGGVNVVYRRGDGHIGWIDPSVGSDGGMNGSEVLEG